MAKQLVSPIERHIEKVVVGIAAILLLGVIAKYLVTSPNQMEVDGVTVWPGTIDQKVTDKGSDVRRRIQNAQLADDPFEKIYPDYVAQLDAFANAKVALELPAGPSMGPAVPVVDRAITTDPERQLVDVNKLEKPVLVFGRSTVSVDPDDEDGRFLQTDWVTVSAVFNVREQTERQGLEYGPKRRGVFFGPTHLQRRTRRHDGSWSDDDWEDLDPWPAVEPLDIPSIRLIPEEGTAVVSRNDRNALGRFFGDLQEAAQQLQMIRPFMADIREGTRWTVPMVTNRRDVLRMDHEYVFPDDPPDDLDDRYSDAEEETKAEVAVDPREMRRKLLEESATRLQRAQDECSADEALKAYNRAFEVQHDPAAKGGETRRAGRLMERAENLQDDIKRGTCRPKSGGSNKANPVNRDRVPTQQVWAHDARPHSLQDARTYQYRMRVTIYNRLAGEPAKFENPQDALVVFLEGPWSEPSDPATIEPDTYFFATNSDKRKNEVSLDMFRWFEGVWVKTREKFHTGDAVTDQRRCAVPSLDTVGEVDKPMIRFDTGYDVVDIDHDRLHRSRRRAGRGGVSFDPPSRECSVVLRRADGRLVERFVPTDKANPGKGTVTSKVFKEPRKPRGP